MARHRDVNSSKRAAGTRCDGSRADKGQQLSWQFDIATLISNYGIAILAPLAVIEGPIVTIIAAYLASQSLLRLSDVIVCVILAKRVVQSIANQIGQNEDRKSVV